MCFEQAVEPQTDLVGARTKNGPTWRLRSTKPNRVSTCTPSLTEISDSMPVMVILSFGRLLFMASDGCITVVKILRTACYHFPASIFSRWQRCVSPMLRFSHTVLVLPTNQHSGRFKNRVCKSLAHITESTDAESSKNVE